MVEVDVVVIGAGGAGFSAAIEARLADASALILEAAAQTGGSTALAGGVILAADTSVQHENAVLDHRDAFYERYLVLNRWSVEPSLARVLCGEAGDVVEWFRSRGVEFDLLPPNSAEGIPRGHMAVGGGAKLAHVLEKEARALGVELRLHSRVEGIRRDSGRWRVQVGGAGAAITARSLVVATGGFGQSPEMLKEYFPSAAAHGDLTWSVSAPTCVGDGLFLGQQVGAAITGRDQGLALITPGFAQNFEVVPPAWLVFVNREGRRYVDEMMPYSMLSETTSAQSGGSGFALLDEATRAQADPMDLTHAGIVSLDWNRDSIDANVRTGRVVKADTLAELARRAGIEADALAQTIASFNADCAAGRDSRFMKSPEWLRPVATPPFYAAEIRPALVALTSCGLRIDADARVLRGDGAAIPGLFAAGEATGGVVRQYGGSGNSIANALVFGRRAGRAAARRM